MERKEMLKVYKDKHNSLNVEMKEMDQTEFMGLLHFLDVWIRGISNNIIENISSSEMDNTSKDSDKLSKYVG